MAKKVVKKKIAENKMVKKPVEKKIVQKKERDILQGIIEEDKALIESNANSIIRMANGKIDKNKLLGRLVKSYYKNQVKKQGNIRKNDGMVWYAEERKNITTMSVCLGEGAGYSKGDNELVSLFYENKPLFDISVVHPTLEHGIKDTKWVFAISCMADGDRYSYRKIKQLHGNRLWDALQDWDEGIGDMMGTFGGHKERTAYDALLKIVGEIFVDALGENKVGLPKKVVQRIRDYNANWCNCFLFEIQRDGRRNECPITFNPYFEHFREDN